MLNPFRVLRRSLAAQQRQGYDVVLIVLTALLCIVGTLIIFSAAGPIAEQLYGDRRALLRAHLLHLLLGAPLLWIGAHIPYRRYRALAPLFLPFSLLLLLAVWLPGIGHEAGGARRWLRIGSFGVQPVEIVKLALIVHAAALLDREAKQLYFGWPVLLHAATIGIPLLLVLLQPDFGNMMLCALLLLLMGYASGMKLGHLLLGFFSLATLGGALVWQSEYRLRRLLVFLDPWADRFDAGFQIVQSQLALGSGGLWGRGLGNSRQKLLFLPDAHTDFIFAILGEELGLVGVWSILGLFAAFLWRAWRSAWSCADSFGQLLGFGIATLFALQTGMNLAVAMGLTPTKGLPLPFLSYGGSSLLISMFMVGVLLNIGHSESRARESHPRPPPMFSTRLG